MMPNNHGIIIILTLVCVFAPYGNVIYELNIYIFICGSHTFITNCFGVSFICDFFFLYSLLLSSPSSNTICTKDHTRPQQWTFTVVGLFLLFPSAPVVEAEVEAMCSFSVLILLPSQNGSEVDDAIVCFHFLTAEAPVEDYWSLRAPQSSGKVCFVPHLTGSVKPDR